MKKKIWFEVFLTSTVIFFLLFSGSVSAAEIRPSPGGVLWRQDVLENPLGKQTNETLGVTDVNLSEWVGNAIQFSIINGVTVLAGKDVLVGGQASGVLGQTMAMNTGMLKSPPDLQTMAYLKNTLADNILFPRPVYAKTGAQYLNTIVGIWDAVRNISYSLTAVILVVMGFMVMFRYRTDPRTVITFVTALPRIVISLVLITFSYALAGFMIDLGILLKHVFDSTFGGLFRPYGGMIPIEPFHVMTSFIDSFASLSFLDPKAWLLGKSNIYLGGTGISSAFIALILTIIAVAVAFYLFFILIFRYAGIFVQVIFAPLAFLWGALPGQEDTITGWFKSFAVNVLTFPVIYFMVSLANYIAEFTKPADANMPIPEDLGWSPAFKVPGTEIDIGGLVAFGILVAATRVPAALEDALAIRRPPPSGVAPMKLAAKIPVIGSLFK